MATPFTIPYVNTPAYFTGIANTSDLVPNTWPVAINGRPYMLDMESGEFQQTFEPRVRDSVDQSTAPSEAAINPGGLWRRGQDSWHFGAGQRYADLEDSLAYRFYKSKGVNPWVKGQVSLLNATVLNTGTDAPTSSVGKAIVVADKIFVIDNTTVKYASSTSGNWTTITSPAGTTALKDLATDGTNLFACFTATSSGVHSTPLSSPGTWTRMVHEDLDKISYVNGRLMGSDGNILYDASVRAYSSGSIAAGDTLLTHRNTGFTWVGFAGGNTHIYAAGYAGNTSLIYKTTIKTDGTSLDAASVAAQLPLGEIVSGIDSYLGLIFIGSNKGVRLATADTSGNLTLGSLIPTGNSVVDFAFDNRYAWFTWTNYDGSSGGLGRLDIATFTSTNTPAYATDLMYDSTANVLSVSILGSAKVMTIAGVGVVYENTASLVTSGTIETGIYRWGIPDRKFIARFDVRALPLDGTITSYMSLDEGEYTNLGAWNIEEAIEATLPGSDDKAIEAEFKLELTRATTVTLGPTLTRWMARAYAAPFRSEVFVLPILLHKVVKLKDRDVYLDVNGERERLAELLQNPRVVALQIGPRSYAVIAEDLRWQPMDAQSQIWDWEGTATMTLRSVEN